MKHAELRDGVVMTLRSAPYPEHDPITIEVPDEVELGWIALQDGAWAPGPVALRTTARAQLRADFMAEADAFVGPFFTLFQAITPLLDAGRDAAAELLIRSAAAPAFFTDLERASFEDKRDEYADKIAALPPLPAP